jgi:hypothetical protein
MSSGNYGTGLSKFYPAFNSSRSWINLLPSLEIGIENLVFFKFIYKNLIDENQYEWYDSGGFNWIPPMKSSLNVRGECKVSVNVFSFISSFNVFRKLEKHMLNIGFGFNFVNETYYFRMIRDHSHDDFYYDPPQKFTRSSLALGLPIAYKYNAYKGFWVGIDSDFFLHLEDLFSSHSIIYGGLFLSVSYKL